MNDKNPYPVVPPIPEPNPPSSAEEADAIETSPSPAEAEATPDCERRPGGCVCDPE